MGLLGNARAARWSRGLPQFSVESKTTPGRERAFTVRRRSCEDDQHPGEGTWDHCATECYGRLCPYHPQLTSCEDRCRPRRDGKEQIVPRLTSPPLDQHIHRREREAGGCDHRPNYGDPAHGVTMAAGRRRLNMEEWSVPAAHAQRQPTPDVRSAVRSTRNMLAAKRPFARNLMLVFKSLRKGDTLVVWQLDRLGRSLGDLIHLTIELRSCGAKGTPIANLSLVTVVGLPTNNPGASCLSRWRCRHRSPLIPRHRLAVCAVLIGASSQAQQSDSPNQQERTSPHRPVNKCGSDFIHGASTEAWIAVSMVSIASQKPSFLIHLALTAKVSDF